MDVRKLPKYPKARPDFQAPGPHVLVEKSIALKEEEEDEVSSPVASNELEEVADYGPPKHRYYASEKILGKLYRDIDESQFLAEIQSPSGSRHAESRSLVDAIWLYVRDKTAMIQWRHYLEFAQNVKDKYNLAPTISPR